ncbi:hypothetical protein Tco_1001065 [Tanacetum coccineum]
MEEYATKTQRDYYSGITKIMIDGKAIYELKRKFLEDLQNNAFSVTNGEDTVEYIENFLKIVDPLDFPNVSDDEEVLSDLEETYEVDEDEIAESLGLKDEWNKRIPWVPEEPWSEHGTPTNNVHHICESFRFKNGKAKWPTCNSNEDGFCNGGELPGMVRQKAMNERSRGDATQGVINFCAWLKRCFGNFHELDYELSVKLKDYWWKMNNHECSLFSSVGNHIRRTYANTNIDANYNLYLNISRKFNHDAGRNNGEARDPNDDHAIGNFDNDLVRDNTPYHANKEEERYEEDMCELLGNPRAKNRWFAKLEGLR